MTMIDERGRLFGRFNLIDSLVVLLVLIAIPMAYGTYLLFRPGTPRIDSVSPSNITKEEQRVTSAARLVAKFKIKGTGFTPLLRARIGDADALGFVFESPNSADVLVGPIPAGPQDLILMDGVQEVARARGAITVVPNDATFLRAAGRIVDLDPVLLKEIQVGLEWPAAAPAFKVLALGPPERGRARVNLAGTIADVQRDGLTERAAVLTLRCDPSFDDSPCTVGAASGMTSPVMLSLPGPSRYFRFAVSEIYPDGAPRKARLQIRLDPESVAALHLGDRDDLLDERAAVVTAVAGNRVTLDAGVDDSREGWRYRSRLVKPGAPFRLSTPQYELSGRIETVTLLEITEPVKP